MIPFEISGHKFKAQGLTIALHTFHFSYREREREREREYLIFYLPLGNIYFMKLLFSVNGNSHKTRLSNMDMDEICKWIELARTRSGVEIVRKTAPFQTHYPSIQGVWHPFLFKDPSVNLKTFPDSEYGSYPVNEMTATERVLQLAERMKQLELEKGNGKDQKEEEIV